MQANLDKIFRAYDIRGVYGKDFDDDFAHDFGRAFVSWLNAQPPSSKDLRRVFVTQDVRPSSPNMAHSLIKGLLESGANVVDAGIEPTPVMYYLVWKYPNTAGISVTASHNPAEYNGIKPAIHPIVLTQEQQSQIRKLIEAGDYRDGHGSVKTKDYNEEFLTHTLRNLNCSRKLKVVVDTGNGTCGPLALKMLEKMGVTAIPLHCEPIAGFPNHQPDPLEPENIKDLQAAVVENKADLGIAFDGDGDRVAFVDDLGGALTSDESLILFLRDLVASPGYRKGSVVLHTVIMSNSIAQEARRLGAEPVVTPVGHTFIQHEMKERAAILAGETSGHFFFAENGPYDDAFHAAARFLHLVSRFKEPLSKVRESIPKFVATHAFYVPCPDERKFKVISAVAQSLGKSHQTITMDGVRVDLQNAWGILRASNTSPKLNLRFEGKTRKELESVYTMFKTELSRHEVKLPELDSVLNH